MSDKWDIRFLLLAQHISHWSKDPSTKCGAVVVRPDRTVASMGFNGFPRGVPDDPALYADRAEKYQRVIHAEVNALLTGQNLSDCTLYTWPPGLAPTCDRCATLVIQAGIKRVVYAHADSEFARRWEPERAIALYRSAGVSITALPLELVGLDHGASCCG